MYQHYFTYFTKYFTIYSCGLQAFVGIGLSYRIGKKGKSVLLTDLAASPPFVCFDDIWLSYESERWVCEGSHRRSRKVWWQSFFDTIFLGGSDSNDSINLHSNQSPIMKKCKLFEENLPLLKRALKCPNRIIVYGKIDRNNPYHFGNQTQFLDHIRQQLLPLINTSRCFEFNICFGLDETTFGLASTNTIASILQFSPIKRCLNVQISLSVKQPVRLPIAEISRWLNRKTDQPEVSGKKKSERFLQILLENNRIRNAHAIFYTLKKVCI